MPLESADEEARLSLLRKICLFDYLLHIVGVLLSAGVLSLLALVINYAKRGDARGTIYESHMNWMIRSFWWTLLWLVLALGVTLLSFGILFIVALVPVVWFLYRMVVGVFKLIDGKPMPG